MASPYAIGGDASARYILSATAVNADSAPDPRFTAGPILSDLFRAKCLAALPVGSILDLGQTDQLSTEDRAIVLIPIVRAARVAHEVQAGSIHRFEAIIVGDISAIDPWTNVVLYSGTRMVSAEVSLGASRLGETDQEIRKAFSEAASRWMDSTIQQVKEKLAPFVLSGATIAAPKEAENAPVGIWPYGTIRGVPSGATLAGGGGRLARVSHAFPHYSLLRDAANPSRALNAGEDYSLTILNKPTERPEPRVALGWLGSSPTSPEGIEGHALDAEAFLGLLSNYLGKEGGLSVLPTRISNTDATRDLALLSENISNHSKAIRGNLASFDRRTLVETAKLSPDFRVEVGIQNQYHGTRTKSDKSIEHLYRLTLLAAVYRREGTPESETYPLLGVFGTPLEVARVEMAGVRDIDSSASWFTLCRNAAINLATAVRESILATPRHQDSARREGTVDDRKVVRWAQGEPAPYAPLQRLRPYGELVSPDGGALGTFLLPVPPSQGYLNSGNLSKEPLRPGDLIRYDADVVTAPLLQVQMDDFSAPPLWKLDKAWLLRLVAGRITQGWRCKVVSPDPDDSRSTSLLQAKRLMITLSALAAQQEGADLVFQGQWRARLLPPEASISAPPLMKFGVEVQQRRTLSAHPLLPVDSDQWLTRYVDDALSEFVKTGVLKGVANSIAIPD